MSQISVNQIQVNHADLSNTRLYQTQIDPQSLESGQLILHTDTFGFSANNITYALFGERMGYWGFFPADPGWGIVPVWGFATVVASRHPDIPVGEKVFGYLPMATHLVVSAEKVSKHGFMDVSESRKSISPVYDHYVRCAADPGYQADREAWQLNFRPLFMTSFVLNAYVLQQLGQQSTVILTSASSKTAYGTAFLLNQARNNENRTCRIIGLTSAHNKTFVEQLGCYDEVKGYDEIEDISSEDDAFVLDFAGNKSVLLGIEKALDGHKVRHIFIGATDVQAQTDKPMGNLDGEVFFAPSQVKALNQAWGPEVFQARYAQSWQKLAAHLAAKIQAKSLNGSNAIIDTYQQGLAGNFDAHTILQLSFDETS